MNSQTRTILGMPVSVFHRLWVFYVGIQFVIWVKIFLFFLFFGKGISYSGLSSAFDFPFIGYPVFANGVQLAEYGFHQSMHVLIAVWVFFLAKSMIDFNGRELMVWFLFAVILHNVAYWVFSAHPSFLYSIKDFIADYFMLWFFFLVFLFIQRKGEKLFFSAEPKG